jgi:hypothetical protein
MAAMTKALVALGEVVDKSALSFDRSLRKKGMA